MSLCGCYKLLILDIITVYTVDACQVFSNMFLQLKCLYIFGKRSLSCKSHDHLARKLNEVLQRQKMSVGEIEERRGNLTFSKLPANMVINALCFIS